jgi:selenocysteine lyase/cysteine desulfurase
MYTHYIIGRILENHNATEHNLHVGKRTSFLFCEENHNSVNGIQCFARRRGATVSQVLLDRDLLIEAVALQQQLRGKCRPGARQLRGLLAYPAQSNLSGVKHSLGEDPIYE